MAAQRLLVCVLCWPLATGFMASSPLSSPASTKSRHHSSKRGNNEIEKMEQEVMQSSRTRMDIKTVREFLDDDTSQQVGLLSSWKLAIGSGLAAAMIGWLSFHSLVASAILFASAAFLASGDPLDDDGVAGALARLLGRFAVGSWKTSAPKVKAVLKAVVQDTDEVTILKTRLDALESEVQELRSWKKQRLAVDDSLSNYTLDDLKELARKHGLTVGGTKPQLLMRLVQARVVEL